MSRRSCRPCTCDARAARRSCRGFTLIEVIGALMIFSMGVLMVVQVSGALGSRMRYAGARSAIVVFANESLDSLIAEPSALAAGTSVDTLDIEGMSFVSRVTVTTVTPVLKRIDVAIVPVSGGEGPSHSITSYRSEVW